MLVEYVREIALTRRRWLLQAWAWTASSLAALRAPAFAAGAPGSLKPLAAPVPVARLHVGEGGVLHAVSRTGELWSFGGDRWQLAGKGLDPGAPIGSGFGRVVGRAASGGLWVLESGRVSVADAPVLGSHAGLFVLALGVIAVARAGSGESGAHQVVRLEPQAGGRWREVARGTEAVLPDAQPVQFDPSGRGGGDDADGNGHVAVLAGPDDRRYRHAVLGDGIEATSILYLERHTLQPLARLELAPPHVFEDIVPRPIRWGSGRALLTVRSGPQGAQMAVVAPAAQGKDAGSLVLAALGEPIGTANRWLAPTTDGTNLFAVHTPHIGGVLHRYRPAGSRLAGEQVGRGVTSHVLGERELDLCAWAGGALHVPAQDRRTLFAFDAPATATQPARATALPAQMVMSRAWRLNGREGVVLLLADGGVAWVEAARVR